MAKLLCRARILQSASVRKRTELGIGHIPEDRHKRGLLLDSDLEENAILGVHYRAPVAVNGFLNSAVIEKRTKHIIENFDVRPPNPNLAAKSLSGGNQQKLIIGREFEFESETSSRFATDARRGHRRNRIYSPQIDCPA